MTDMDSKKQLRKKFSEIRGNITDKAAKDAEITERFLEMERVQEADCIMVYASFGSEVETYGIIDAFLGTEKKIAYPRCEDNGTMVFHVVESFADLHEGMYRISEPDISLPVAEITEKTVCIIPGLAFTEKGGRLGYGGGYYDRFLLDNPDIYTIALSYEELITDELPLLQHDLLVNSIVTEERTVLCNE
ncbi:MAG: 5-formyltetrahydrofolate cyclo-ligase [Ruminococcus sp.]|nr:5-formyltetrahydrofolate cyclo-ligase [Ruminococcus sp.]